MKKIIVFTILLFWPLNLLLNSKDNFQFNTLTKTVFVNDYQAEQRILDKINLYPTVFFARVYQNKGRIYLDKITDNFFALTDPSNYFFGFHPREIIGNQNLKKFPFVSIIFFLTGLFYFKSLKHKKFILIFSSVSLFYLSILENFDRVDFLLWLPITLITLHGLNLNYKNKYWDYLALIFWIFTIPQIARIFLGYQ